jgi:hypothetical protein
VNKTEHSDIKVQAYLSWAAMYSASAKTPSSASNTVSTAGASQFIAKFFQDMSKMAREDEEVAEVETLKRKPEV